MSLAARPLRHRPEVQAIFDKKMADFQHKAKQLVLHHLEPSTYFEAASEDPDVRLALDTRFIERLEADLRDPVIVRLDNYEVYTCPALVLKVLADEAPEIHRPFVEGAFFRKLFRFFVPATFDGGESWEVTQQVREIMQRHFAFQLVACESVLRQAS
jgi:hypothetical protein